MQTEKSEEIRAEKPIKSMENMVKMRAKVIKRWVVAIIEVQ